MAATVQIVLTRTKGFICAHMHIQCKFMKKNCLPKKERTYTYVLAAIVKNI